jgi:hypothetical protein
MLTSAQIITLATQIAKVPGMIQQAGQFMNARLIQIALEQDLDIIRRTTTLQFVIGNPTYNLPANYLRAREVFYTQSGQVFYLSSRSLSDYDQLFKGPGEQEYPYLYATDLGATPPTINFYPAPSISTPVTIRYMDNLVEVVTPETSSVIPWFQDRLLLIKMIAEDLMDIADDARADTFAIKNDDKLRRLIQMANDKEDRAITVAKDPKAFRPVRHVRPTKLQGD